MPIMTAGAHLTHRSLRPLTPSLNSQGEGIFLSSRLGGCGQTDQLIYYYSTLLYDRSQGSTTQLLVSYDYSTHTKALDVIAGGRTPIECSAMA